MWIFEQRHLQPGAKGYFFFSLSVGTEERGLLSLVVMARRPVTDVRGIYVCLNRRRKMAVNQFRLSCFVGFCAMQERYSFAPVL